jgi:tetratricopeptide (TPR) repeat protein
VTATDDTAVPPTGDAAPAAAGDSADSGGTADRRSAGASRRARLDPDALAALEDQRDFLLRSLDDLERERAAGDVDEHDYATLKDDYTARAAGAIRAIDSHQARAAAAGRPRSWRRLVATMAAVAAFAVLAGVLVAQASGRRESGDALTGEIRESTRIQLAEARNLAAEQRYDEAVAVYDEVLEAQPANAEALAYKGWVQFLSGDAPGATDTLTAAIRADQDLPDSYAFLAVILSRAGADESALDALDRFEALDPPPDALGLVAGLRTELEGRLAGTTTTTATTPPRLPTSPTSTLTP